MSDRTNYASIFLACVIAMGLGFAFPTWVQRPAFETFLIVLLLIISGSAWLASPLSVEAQMNEHDLFEPRCPFKTGSGQ